MVYRLGEKVRRGLPTAIIPGVVLLSSLLLGVITIVHADSSASPPNSHPSKTTKNISRMPSHKPPTSKSTVSTPPGGGLPAQGILRTVSCALLFPPKNANLINALSPQLVKLAEYEQACNGALAERSSFFVPTPTTIAEAQADAADVAVKLKEYSSMGIKPLVFIEPTASDGNIDLDLYRAGTYDAALDRYFAAIKAAGITDTMMGMWVAMPEGNIPVWTSVDPATFAANVTKTIGFQKKYFPGSLASIMLDCQTYPSADSWNNGSYASLLPYVQNIPKGLVDSFGLQGFPWAPPANEPGDKVYDPATYLPTRLAGEAAKALGVSSIWLNTGTFGRMYVQNSAQTVTAEPAERQAMLDGVLAQAKNLKSQGFNVSIHLFAEDKSKTPEGIDWSYWQTQSGKDANTSVFTTFVNGAATNGLPLWLFDANNN